MNWNFSMLRLNIVIILSLWSVSGAFGILYSFELTGWLLYTIMPLYTIFSILMIYKKYTPVMRNCTIKQDYFIAGNKFISANQILCTYQITPFEKLFFAVKSPEHDYSATLSAKGLIVKTLYDSYLIDYPGNNFIHDKVQRVVGESRTNHFLFLILYVFPIAAPLLSLYLKVDTLVYPCIMALAVFFAVIRILPPFYLGTKIPLRNLPLSLSEANEFHNITIIKGFIISDKLSVIPFAKPSYLEGLAVDGIIKKYIVLNPRLFALGSEDYLRFVIFHELSHIKHHDGSGAIIVPVVIILLDIIFNFLPKNIQQTIPYWDYILMAIVAIYFIIAALTRKKVEKRADTDSINRIGSCGVERIKNDLGYDIIK